MMLYHIDSTCGLGIGYQIASARKKLLQNRFPTSRPEITFSQERKQYDIHVRFLSIQDCFDIMKFITTEEYLREEG